MVQIFSRMILKQSLSRGPKGEISVGFMGISTFKRKTVCAISVSTGREQKLRFLNLGGNTENISP